VCADVSRQLDGIPLSSNKSSSAIDRYQHNAKALDLEFLCQTAARICVKDAIETGASPEEVTVSRDHFERAIITLGYTAEISRSVIPVTP